LRGHEPTQDVVEVALGHDAQFDPPAKGRDETIPAQVQIDQEHFLFDLQAIPDKVTSADERSGELVPGGFSGGEVEDGL
jgi:hypothetical protein